MAFLSSGAAVQTWKWIYIIIMYVLMHNYYASGICKMHKIPLFSGIDFKIKTIELQGKKIKLQIWYVCLIACLVTLMLLYCIICDIIHGNSQTGNHPVRQYRHTVKILTNPNTYLSRTAKHVRSRNRKAKTLHKSEAKHGP